MAFIGRARELATLEAAFADDRAHLWPVYGRRRVGKTALLRRFCADRPSLFFTGSEAPAGPQQKLLLETAAATFRSPLLAQVAPSGWHQVLELVVNEGLRQTQGKLIVVLDEFQWLAATSPELPSVLQALWDSTWAPSGRVMLILCGSYIGFMEREVLGRKSPLFGRRTGRILLEPLDFREARQFHPDYSLVDAARTWFLCGGIPHHLKAFRQERSVEENLRDVVLDPFGALHAEPDYLLREELRDLPSYHAVLMAIAGGARRAKDIAAASTVPPARLSYYLGQLVGLRYVRKRYPLTGAAKPNPKSVRYEVADPLLQFWFRFVYPHPGALEAQGAARFLETHVRPGLASWFGTRFEALCREATTLLYRAEDVPGGFEVGSFWSARTQIDVVVLRGDGRTDLGECKWADLPRWRPALEQLERRLPDYPNARGASLGRLIFARRGPATPLPGVRCLDLAALYGEPPRTARQEPR